MCYYTCPGEVPHDAQRSNPCTLAAYDPLGQHTAAPRSKFRRDDGTLLDPFIRTETPKKHAPPRHPRIGRARAYLSKRVGSLARGHLPRTFRRLSGVESVGRRRWEARPLGGSPAGGGITLIEPRRGTDASAGGFAGLVGPPGGRSECPAAQPPRGAHLTRSAVAPKVLKIGLCARGAKVRFGVVGNQKNRASSPSWAGGHDLMPKSRWCGLQVLFTHPCNTAGSSGISRRGYEVSLG